MARIMRLPDEALPSAAMLGRAFQYVNFVRDLQEDLDLGRRYLPRVDVEAAGLADVTEASARQARLRSRSSTGAAPRYADGRGKERRASATSPHLAHRHHAHRGCRVPAEQIERDPFVIFRGRSNRPPAHHHVPAAVARRARAS